MKLKHYDVMVDLETLATENNPALLMLSAIVYNRFTGKHLKVFSKLINPMSCVKHGFEINGNTVSWWLSQDKKVVQEVYLKAHSEGEDVKNVLFDFSIFIEEAKKELGVSSIVLQGNGILSDNRWIDAAYGKVGLLSPFKYYEHNDVRTYVNLGKDILGVDYKKSIPFKGDEHNALDDAAHQIKYCVKILKEILKLKK